MTRRRRRKDAKLAAEDLARQRGDVLPRREIPSLISTDPSQLDTLSGGLADYAASDLGGAGTSGAATGEDAAASAKSYADSLAGQEDADVTSEDRDDHISDSDSAYSES